MQRIPKLRKYKLFISYARESSEVKNNLIEYLKPYEEEGRLEIWHDRELNVGDKFDSVIKEKLLDSDIVVFLLSQHFLNSKYCKEVEQELALKKFKESENDYFRIIPVVASQCHFKKSPLNEFNMSLDAKSVSEYGSDAYFQISKDIAEVLDVLDSNQDYNIVPKEPDEHLKDRLSNNFRGYLSELGFTIQKSGIDSIMLLDLFVYPDLKRINNEIEKIDVFVDSEKKINSNDYKNQKRIFLGDEQSGKSTLAKILFLRSLSDGLTPVLLKGEEIKGHKDIDRIIDRNYQEQYEDSSYLDMSNLVLIIDGLTDSSLNQRFMKLFISSELSRFHSVQITADIMLRMQDQIINEVNGYEIFEIQNLGSKKKDELIDKWNMLGRDESDCIKNTQSIHDYLTQSIESIMMKNIVPSKPIFILMILQILESHNTTDFTLTSYGHCYHSLIIDALNRAKIRNDLHGDYFNYLSELAFYMYSKSKTKINLRELNEFQEEYSTNYLINSHEEVFSKILKSRIIIKDYKDEHKFQYKYLFYFFIAKYIADSENITEEIDKLCDKIHSEKHANILIFVTHHTKQKGVIDRIINKVSSIFSNQEPARLDNEELEFLNEFASQIPKMVIDKTSDVEVERKKRLEERDQIEKESNLVDEEDDTFDENGEDLEVINQDLLDVNRSYRALEILGQIIRNRKGSLPKPLINNLGLQAYTVGLRFLKYYFGITKGLKNELIDEIHRLIETKKSWSKERITQEARYFYWSFSYSMALNVVRKTALSVGHKDLIEFYEDISNNIDTEVARLIEVQIEIEFTKRIPKDKLSSLWQDLEGNLVTRRLLQEIIVRHLHLNYVDHNEKHWISNHLEIPLLEQGRYQQNVKLAKQSSMINLR